jgi:hypothetical protein
MAITWKWEEKCGEATFRREDGSTYNVNLYVGNCFLIMIYEYKEDGKEKYSLASFCVDEDHMERCLKDNIYSDYETLTAITINKAKCRNYKKIVALLAEYMDDIDITIYKDGNYTWHEFPAPRQVISDMEFREIAEASVSYMYDNDILEDFIEDRGIEFDDRKKSYFCIYDF